MPAIPLPPDEQARLRILQNSRLLDSPEEERFDRITEAAQKLLRVPVSLFSLVDSDRQLFKSCAGLEINETPRGHSFCAYTILDREPLIIPDALQDKRVFDSPMVVGVPHIRAYLGIPIFLQGKAIGTLCCIDFTPRNFDRRDIETLTVLASWIERELELAESEQLLRELRNSERKADELFQQAPYPILQIGQDGTVEDLNEQAKSFWRYHLGYVPNLLTDPRFGSWGLPSILNEASSEESLESDSLTLLNKRGTRLYLRLTVRTLLGSSWDVSYLVGIQNVSEQVYLSDRASVLQARLAAKESEIEKIHQRRDGFIARLGHEIRNPLSGIVGLVELMKTDDGLNQENLRSMASCADALVSLVDNTLDITRINQGRMSLELVPFHLPQLIRSVCRVSVQTLASNDVRTRVKIRTNHKVFRGDPGKIRQILANLVSNAYKYTESGQIEVTADSSNTGVLFRVADTGQGMTEEFAARVFDAYTQAETLASDSSRGVGLGLAIVKRLVQLLGGKIWVETELGRGSVFSFELPLEACSVSNESESENNELKLELNILVVDDNAINRKIMAMQLEGIGCEVYTAENGARCLDVLARSEIDLVLMDCNMPVLDGYAATRKIREHPENYGEPVVMALTGAGQADSESLCLEAGMDDFVKKPVRIETLQEKIHTLFESRQVVSSR